MRFQLNKQCGPAMLNLLRQIAMTAIPCVRPIAFSVGLNSNVIDTADSVVEDMTAFIHNAMCNKYVTDDLSKKLIVYDATASGVLQASVFEDIGIRSYQDNTILHLLSQTHVSIIFRNARGNFSAKDNISFLQDNAIDTNKYVVVPSRHSAVDSISINEIESETAYIADLTVQSQLYSEEKILSAATAEMLSQVTDLAQKHNFT